MYYTRKAIPLHEFVFVGCWNRRSPQRDAVAERIIHTDVKTVILGGDNVYPLPEDKLAETKTHRAEVFNEGIQLYLDKGKDIIGTLGNHNIAYALDAHNKVVNMRAIQMKTFAMENSYYVSEYEDKCCIVVLDTNLTAGDAMFEWLRSVIDYIKHHGLTYYIVQHEPFFSVKGKLADKKLKDKYQLWENRNTVLEILFTFLPICVLCADTHLFQQVEITDKKTGQVITQIIVGTGGAEHDYNALKAPLEDDLYHYEVTYPKTEKEFSSSYGYLHMKSKGVGDFVHVVAWEGGKRKRKSRKNRK
jgi:hypothetical protein